MFENGDFGRLNVKKVQECLKFEGTLNLMQNCKPLTRGYEAQNRVMLEVSSKKRTLAQISNIGTAKVAKIKHNCKFITAY